MKSARGSYGTTHKQLEHVLGPRDDAGGNGVGDSDVVKEKKEGTWPYYPLSAYL